MGLDQIYSLCKMRTSLQQSRNVWQQKYESRNKYK